MGNWRTVTMHGTVDRGEVDQLRAACAYDVYGEDWGDFGPLSFDPATPGLASLGDWVRPTIAAGGNLAERDYAVDEVAEHLRRLVLVASSLALVVHCGGDYESTACVATIVVAAGAVTVGPAQVAEVAGATDEQAAGRLFGYLTKMRPTP